MYDEKVPDGEGRTHGWLVGVATKQAADEEGGRVLCNCTAVFLLSLFFMIIHILRLLFKVTNRIIGNRLHFIVVEVVLRLVHRLRHALHIKHNVSVQ